MFKAVRYLPIPRDTSPSDCAQPDRHRETLIDISLLLYILNPITTAEEEAVLRRLSKIGVAETLPQLPHSFGA